MANNAAPAHELLATTSSAERNWDLRHLASARTFPWLLFLLSWPLVFYLYNEFDAPTQVISDSALLTTDVEVVASGSYLAASLAAVLGVIGTILLIRYRKRISISPLIVSLAFTWIGWGAISVLWSTDPALSFRRVVYLLLLVLFAAGCAVRMSSVPLAFFVASIPTLGILPGVLAEIRYGTFHPFSGGYRFSGTAVHPNVEAACLAPAFVIFCALCFHSRGKQLFARIAAAGVSGIFLLLTGSRTSAIGAILALGVAVLIILFRDYRRRVPLLVASTFLLIGAAGLGLIVHEAYTSGPNNTPLVGALNRDNDASDATSFNGRSYLWEELLTFASKRPWGGYGYGSFWTPERIEDVSGDQGWTIQQAHSAYLEELLVLGVPGVLLYIGLLISCFFYSAHLFLKGDDTSIAWCAVFALMAVHNLTEAINVNPGTTFILFLLLVMSLGLGKHRPFQSA